MASQITSNSTISCIIGPLWGETTSHQWIPLTKEANDVENVSIRQHDFVCPGTKFKGLFFTKLIQSNTVEDTKNITLVLKIFRKHENIFAISTNPQHRDDTGCCDPSWTCLFYLLTYCQISNISHTCGCLYSIHWSQVFSREWRCSWSSADRRCSNYIWVIDNFIILGAAYIRGFMVASTQYCWSEPEGITASTHPLMECWCVFMGHHIDGLMQERRNSSVLAMELCLSCSNPSTYGFYYQRTININVVFVSGKSILGIAALTIWIPTIFSLKGCKTHLEKGKYRNYRN